MNFSIKIKRFSFIITGLACLVLLFTGFSCQKKVEDKYTLGIFQINDAPTLNTVREGFLQCLKDHGLIPGDDIQMIFRNGEGSIPQVQRIAQDFVEMKVDMIIALSTPCLQAAIHATQEIPVVFSSVANPVLVGAGISEDNHLKNVTGVSSRGPIIQNLIFIKEVLPQVKKIGTLWTPAELNSEYYLDLAYKAAENLGLELISLPIRNSTEVLIAAQTLVNSQVDALFPISDNTINAAFEALGQVAEENKIPLFGGNLLTTQQGACAAMGWDFFEMGYKAGTLALRIHKGENPAEIPFEYMDKVLLYLNLDSARKQGIKFPDNIISRADKIFGEQFSSPLPE